MAQESVCPECGGPTSVHEETIIMLGHPDRVRHRHLCQDVRCGGSSLEGEDGWIEPEARDDVRA